MHFVFDWAIAFVPLAFLLAFTIPGIVLLQPIKLRLFELLSIGTGLGIACWSLQGFAFGLIGLRYLSYIYIAFFFLAFLFLIKKSRPKVGKILSGNVDYFSLFLVGVCAVVSLSAVWFMGVNDNKGLFFCCRGVPDAIYHLSLTHELINNFPPFEPGMSGVKVQNYHYLSNLVVADLSRVFKLDYVDTQFKYINILLILVLSSSVFILANLLGLKRAYSRILILLLFFGGDILYILFFLRGGGFNFSVTILDDATKLFAGPPRAFSITLFFIFLCLFTIWIKRSDKYAGILCGLILGLLAGFKIYTSIFGLAGFFFLSIYFLHKKSYQQLIPIILSFIITALYFLIVNRHSGGLHFNGFWLFDNFSQRSDLTISKLYYLKLAATSNHSWFKTVFLNLVMAGTYFLFLFGTVNLAFFQSKKSLKLFPVELNILVISGILSSLFLGSFFIQDVGGANTVQFIISAFILASIYTSLAIYYWTKGVNRYLKFMIILIFVVLTIPRALHESSENITSVLAKRGEYVKTGTIEALNYLKNQTPQDSKIIVDPNTAENESSMYISFLSSREQFLSGAGVLRDHGQDTTSRIDDVKTIYAATDSNLVNTLLTKNEIDYVYLPQGVKLGVTADNNLETVFQNSDVTILKVRN